METAEPQPAASRNRSILKAALLLAFIVGAILLVRFSPVKGYLTVERLGEFLDTAGFWAPLVFVAIYVAGVCLFVPGTLLTGLGAALFGPYWGFVYVWIGAMLGASPTIHVLRDPTRGGLATTLNEIAAQSKCCITLNENSIPVHPAVNAACEMLGFDPLYVANEGKLVAMVAKQDAERMLAAMRKTRYGEESVIIGEVSETPHNRVLLRTAIGTTRIVDMLAGEMLPRIC